MAAFKDQTPYWAMERGSLGQATLAVTLSLGIISILVVATRLYVRKATQTLDVADLLMTGGCVFYTICCIFVCLDVYAGLGTLDTNLPDTSEGHVWNNIVGTKWLAIFQYSYCWTLPFIKASIGASLLNLTTQRRYRYPIFAIIILSVICTLVGFGLLITICKPIAKTWFGDLVQGECTSGQLYSTFSYIISIVIVVTDRGCAIIPTFLIWGLNMPRRSKISAYVLVAFGSLANVSTLVRLPYLVAYTATSDALYHKANIVIWSMVEMGVGIVAGSLPPLRRVFLRLIGHSYRNAHEQPNPNVPRSRYRSRHSGKGSAILSSLAVTDRGTNVGQGSGDWTELTDTEGQKDVLCDKKDRTPLATD